MTLENWLLNICDTESPDKSIIGFNFGLFESEDGFTIYLIGSKEFDEDDPDWATNIDFEPEEKYFPLPAEGYNHLKWEQVLEKVKSQLEGFAKTDKFKKSFFSRAQAITIGFDDGDLERIK